MRLMVRMVVRKVVMVGKGGGGDVDIEGGGEVNGEVDGEVDGEFNGEVDGENGGEEGSYSW